jgi:branched-chain amino acid transport system permease protein
MRFLFKTDYAQDLKLAGTAATCSGTGCCALWLLAAPVLLPEYLLAQLTFILIYGIVGSG